MAADTLDPCTSESAFADEVLGKAKDVDGRIVARMLLTHGVRVSMAALAVERFARVAIGH